jgi:hypothetical protein
LEADHPGASIDSSGVLNSHSYIDQMVWNRHGDHLLPTVAQLSARSAVKRLEILERLLCGDVKD